MPESTKISAELRSLSLAKLTQLLGPPRIDGIGHERLWIIDPANGSPTIHIHLRIDELFEIPSSGSSAMGNSP